MLRTLAASLELLAVSIGLCAAQETSQPAVVSSLSDDVRNERPSPKTNAAASAGEDLAAENELLEAANKSRELAGVPPLRMQESLREAARAHGQRMIADGQLEHQLPGEPALLERIALVSPLRMDRAGENIANATCAPDANDELMHSPPHRKNLLDGEFNVAGIAAIRSKGRLYVVQDFAHEVPSYSTQQSRRLVSRAVAETRQKAGLRELGELTTPNLDETACSLASEKRPNAHVLAAAYSNRKIIAYTQSHPEVLPAGALRLLRDPGIRQFAVGSCYARNATYPTGMYWVAILLD